MFITDNALIEAYGTPHRLWQGIPAIEVTKSGRIFSAFYSGGIKEEANNFVVLIKSDDGVSFSEPIAVVYKENYRCYDQCLWIDPLDRLWFIWSCAPEHAVYAVICSNPDADELVWSDEFKIGEDVMMNKPTVLSTGEWLFPIAVWHNSLTNAGGFVSDKPDGERKAFVYKTVDNGKSFTRLGGVDAENRSYDEHMLVELECGKLAMFIRTLYGIAVSYSFDGGKNWTEATDSGLGGPCSRFFIKRLKSDRILLINHYNYTGRSHLTAMLSEDDGKSWKYTLLLDERNEVSYPDAAEGDDGLIYITYDRERGGFKNSLDEVYSSAREILMAKITEEDIISGKTVNPDSKLKCVISKLGKYSKEAENPFNEASRFSDKQLAEHLAGKTNDSIIQFIFDHFNINCMNMHKLDNAKLDSLIEDLDKNDRRIHTVCKIISLVRSVNSLGSNEFPVVERIKNIVQTTLTDELSVRDIAQKLGISMYYMCHVFKKATGITIVDYKKELKIIKAKSMLVNSDKKISEIAQECGFGSDSYFSKVFMESENVSPTEYRSIAAPHRKQKN